MPNWCYNHLTISKENYEKTKHLFINADGEIDFSILIPHDIRSKADCYYHWDCMTNYTPEEEDTNKKIKSAHSLADLPDKFFDDNYGERMLLRDKYGWSREDGAYEWQVRNWGTKWNGGDPDIIDEGDTMIINFDTAWSAPEPFFNALAKHTDFNVSGEEEGGFFEYEGWAENGEFNVDFHDPEPEEDEDNEDEEE